MIRAVTEIVSVPCSYCRLPRSFGRVDIVSPVRIIVASANHAVRIRDLCKHACQIFASSLVFNAMMANCALSPGHFGFRLPHQQHRTPVDLTVFVS